MADAAGARAKIVHVASDFICRTHPSFVGSLLGDKAHSVIFDNSKIKAFVPVLRGRRSLFAKACAAQSRGLNLIPAAC